ncbi:MAG: flagellar biosynthesis protein FliQ [Candidatus Methylomirabilis sp.]|nr:flagellar biosynthesis protein FliQ [Deltaproteobacteria bacterium]
MNQTMILQLARECLTVTMLVGGPILLTSLAMGLLISIFQAVTQINEYTLTFVPKIAAVAAVIALLFPYMLDKMLSFTRETMLLIPQMAR